MGSISASQNNPLLDQSMRIWEYDEIAICCPTCVLFLYVTEQNFKKYRLNKLHDRW